ncbi:TolC family protein [Azotobacter beijerinckii]|uniref:TolC family protein n=1 Tax=Azotobacter beijerinckii TaxID=170623 RepID=UPI0037BF122E
MPDRSGTRLWLAPLLLLAACALGGCIRLGPDFQSPREAWIEHWDSDMLAQASAMHVQPDNRRWWTQLGDPLLDRLIAHADAHNPDLRIAGLRILEARARLGIALSGLSPQLRQVTAEALYLDRHQYGGRFPQDRHAWQYDAAFSIGWELDFWGRYRRAIESADAAYFATQADYQDVLVLLRAQVAQTYFALRTAEARLRIARENAERQKRSFEITERLFLSGNSDELDLQQAKTQYLGTLSTVPEFEALVRQTRNALSVLVGEPPDALPELTRQTGLVPLLDRALLDDVPANLLLRRPDVRAAELQVAAQSAQVGLAETDLYPSLSLLGGIGWSASSLDGSSDTRDLIGGPSIVWNVFDNGRLRNNVRAQDARLQQLIEAYRDRVRQAAREADDAATGLVKALERERILREASTSAQRALTLASAQYREGYTDFQRVLDAQRALLAQQDNYLVTRNTAINSLIDLYKALGGGWYSERPPIDAASREQMAKRTDWGDLLDEVSPSSDKAGSHD